MSRPEDHVAVPTNGHRKALPDGDADLDLAETSDLGGGTPSLAFPGTRPPLPTVTPGQVAVGFGIIAALIVLLLGRRRGRRG
jgi:hypothetical protein